ncbi:CDP-glycerol glycerophosphotransferase family protein [Pseudomonas sp. CM27]|uniref:CDP-glycerol glycerophosphotransferase family protein n=1 Tax=Pseudomonas sp. CM27 TaxID=2738452 RepID=UPI0015578E4A|nr:CDP-glycerol glycerophosphotransferase family protein [Pseudomonas sp. CM27]NQD74515.1 glycosyltransferase [Pseudomonas sp. CM27]
MTEVVIFDGSLPLPEALSIEGKRQVKLVGDDTENLKLLRTQIFYQLKSDGTTDFDWVPTSEHERDDASLSVSLFAGVPADVFLMFDLADRQHLHQLQADGSSVLSNFKKILVPGLWMARSLLNDKKLGLKSSDVVVVGSPRVDYLRSLAGRVNKPDSNDVPRVLYAPIHGNWFDHTGNSMSSNSHFEGFLDELSRHCTLVVAEDQRNKLNKRPITQELLDADVVITDYTSVAYEAWALGKPVIFPRWIVGDAIFEKAPKSAEAEIYSRRLGYHAESFEELIEFIKSGSGLQVSGEVKEFCRDYLSNFDESNSASKICNLLSYLSEPDSAVGESKVRAEIDSYLKEKHWAQAEAALMGLVSIYPDDASLNNKLAIAYQGQHKWWQVVSALKNVVSIFNEDAELYQRLGTAEKKMGHFRSAATAYEKAIKFSKSVPAEWFYRLGYCYESDCHEGASDQQSAVVAYKKACELDKKHKSDKYGIGAFHAAVGRWSNASNAFSAHKSVLKFDFDLNFRLGRAQERCYLWDDAEVSYRTAIGLRMKSAESHFRLGFTLERQQKYAQAFESYKYAIKLSGKGLAEWRYRAGMVLLKLGRFDEACNFFLAVTGTGAPVDFEAKRYEASLMSYRVENVRSDLHQNPGESASWFEYYEAQLQQGNTVLAKEGLANATVYADEKAVGKLISLSNALTNKLDEAALVEARLQRDCTNPETWVSYSKIQVALGRVPQAAEAMQQAIWRSNEHKPAMYYELGRLLALAGQSQEACEAFRAYKVIQRPHGAYEDKLLTDNALNFHATYKEFVEVLPIMEDAILYEVHNGSSMACNPLAIFEYLLADESYRDRKHFWVINDISGVEAKYRSLKNVFFVKRGSNLYLRLIASCKYLICNGTFAEYFVRKPGQQYLNTWHGTPLKTLGRAMNTPPYTRANTARNFLHATHLIFPNEHTRLTQVEGHSIHRVLNGVQLISGYPRNDQLFTIDQDKLDTIRLALGITARKPVVLFAPTYRGSWNSPQLEAEFLIEQLKSIISDDYTLLFRGHHLVEKKLADLDLPVKLAPQSIDTNALLPVADILISDYSSIIVDYMTLKRPVLHFIPDWDDYKSERGLYFERDELPWPQCETAEELRGLIQSALNNPSQYVNDAYNEFHERFCGVEDGKSTQRVVEFFFNHRELKNTQSAKKPIVVRSALGTINGVATSAISLVQNLAAQGNKVVVLLDAVELRKEEAGFDGIRKLEEVADVIFRTGRSSMNLEQQWVSDKFNSEGVFYSETMRDVYDGAARQECYRVLGDLEAEFSVEHQGYHPFWAGFMAALPATRHLIYLHNDMLEESEKRLPNLRKVFKFYDKFDAFLNVSESSMNINRESFKAINPEIVSSFHLVRNGLDVSRIINDAELDLDDEGLIALKSDTRFKIVNVARMWPEKNQVRLIEMAKILVDDGHDIAVYILGTGPLHAQLENLVKELGLHDRVMLLGVKRNPFPFVKASQCHVLSSDYEGQGIVLLEAMTLGVPCVSTNIPGPDDVLENGLGILTPLSAEGLAEGVKQVISGSFQPRHFDAREYNSIAYRDFTVAAQ